MAEKHMAKKQLKADPLKEVEAYDPEDIAEFGTPSDPAASEPVSPLGSPEATLMAGGTSIELLLHEVNQRLEQLQGELAAERELRRGLEKQNFQLQASAAQAQKALADLDLEKKERLELERKLAAVESDMKHASSLAQNVESERLVRLEMERKIGTLEFRAEKMEQVTEELAEERQARLKLEREAATLEIEVQHAKKIEQLLTEERQARANAQMRASTAEAKLAQVEGELAGSDTKRKRSFFGRNG